MTTDHLINGTTRKHYSTKETAQIIRAALKAAFPSVKFSVRTEYASCYSATNVSWVDGPTRAEVELVTDRFTSRWFDGMTDSTTFHEQTYNGERVSFSGWVNVTRKTSPELEAKAEAMAKARGEDSWRVLAKLRPSGVLVTVKR